MKTSRVLLAVLLASLLSAGEFPVHQSNARSAALKKIQVLRQELKTAMKSRNEEGEQFMSRIVRVDGNEVAMATLVDPDRSLWVLPASQTLGRKLTFTEIDGRIVGASVPKLLSRPDNLAVVTLPSKSLEIRTGDIEPGAFVGFPLKGGLWRVGTISTGKRKASGLAAARYSKTLRKHWDRIGLEVSQVRSGFPEVFETQLDALPRHAGAPVFNLEGELLGVVISRSDHHATLVIPLDRILQLFEKKYPNSKPDPTGYDG